LSEEELKGLIMAKGRYGDRKDFPKFWPEMGKSPRGLSRELLLPTSLGRNGGTELMGRLVAAHVPGRPVKYVKNHVQREYDPRGHKGSWSKEEDIALLR
jgi:hypothetical protein